MDWQVLCEEVAARGFHALSLDLRCVLRAASAQRVVDTLATQLGCACSTHEPPREGDFGAGLCLRGDGDGDGDGDSAGDAAMRTCVVIAWASYEDARTWKQHHDAHEQQHVCDMWWDAAACAAQWSEGAIVVT